MYIYTYLHAFVAILLMYTYIYIYKGWLQTSVALCSGNPNGLTTWKRMHYIVCPLVSTKRLFFTTMRWRCGSER